MGNFFGRKKASADEAPSKRYSWDDREDVDPKDLTFTGREKEKLCKKWGAINGNKFSIQDCHDCDIYLFDHSAVITIDNCTNCTFFIGPVKGSVFIRTSTDCNFMIACQQFRTRDCKNIEVLLCCNTLPIIEATEDIRFGCFRGNHRMLRGQFGQAGISLFNNYWHKIHDFTKADDGDNFLFLTAKPDWVDDFLQRRPEEMAEEVVDAEELTAAVPVTIGPDHRSGTCHLFVVFSPLHAKKALEVMLRAAELKKDNSRLTIVRTCEISISPEDAASLFQGSEVETLTKIASKKSAIGLELCGDGCEALVHAATVSLGADVTSFSTGVQSTIHEFFAQTESKMTL